MDKPNDVVVSIRNLKMSYGSKEVLKGINLDVNKGEIIGYIGPNGAGKSTTVKIMLGLVKGYEGEVKIFGNNISYENVEYKHKIGYVPENGEIYDNLTAYEYITFLGEIYGMELKEVNNKAKKLMSLFGIKEAYHSRISSYSKGMRQKLLIISSLIHNPDILFLDEPLSGLDANSVLVFKEVLSKLASEGKTIFYSSHIMEVVEKISSRIILLNNGQIGADGTFEELKKKNMEGSLEQIFNQITGFTKHEEIANEFISILKEV
ncbi:ABC transporter ATP-binding protein [Clostridium botulinum]|uniref:ABC transporter, ATP-binding protein n=1 Tax=Clostridium botulinum (strain 657 / Type Ba4) TaxID=515621 RepID=A0A3F3A806_CLOB6|nr:ABC transporter ATP-binding protein [Clostridium botulinum]AJD25860.1 ABC transporter family protein [Clostridium botulinum CDC_297]EPS48839.1 ABC transporter ATP-binding protein [Clostridium botulinum A1 str. CFSAN002368]ACQ52103.1 ABC transporter, ATP-binding protein [Clostridium botulinum Ba4 str. 657]AJE11332.1 ABC transporter family protein [Clostridium botulinum CDC_1436]AXG92022.1 ABC transporter ATP-binding protein [Clostridium botulinum]